MDTNYKEMSEKALVIVDLQRDFLPGGIKPVPNGDDIIARINEYVSIFSANNLPIFASRDCRPSGTSSGAHDGAVEPCIEGSEGAEFPIELHLPESAMIVTKSGILTSENVSVFAGTVGDIQFADMAHALGITELFVCGLGTDCSLKESVKDARREGFGVSLLIDAIRGFEAVPGDSALAVAEMVKAGARLTALPKAAAGLSADKTRERKHGAATTAKSLQTTQA
ncbi:MAG: isochorismatase family protein [Chitinivibrionales bacterium]|nr:isochorismatase family protein [Chitinivibrionales bacterium]MBD3356238.1 isochorismatase family protein [Chitinivibrionales bacterium]